MRKTSTGNKIFFFATIAVNLLLVAAVVLLMAHVQQLLDSDVRINLTEIVTQNRDVITGKINLEVNNLQSKSEQIAERLKNEQTIDDACLKKSIEEYAAGVNDPDLYIASKAGKAFFPNATSADIAGRQYFKLAIEDIPNISVRIISRVTGEDVFVISVPLKLRGEIIGSIQRSYLPEQMYRMCSVSLFSEKGFIHIVNSTGYIMVTSQRADYELEWDNFFRSVYAQGNQTAAEQLIKDIQNSRSGLAELTLDGERIFSAYTPITGVHDWYLISSVSKQAISPNANVVIKMFYVILMVVVVIFAVSLFYFFFNKRRQHSKLERIAFVDTVTKGNTYNKFLDEVKNIFQRYPEKQFALLTFDIDNFKFINSSYGFDRGDAVLREVYSAFSSKLGVCEIAARISGDHFVALLDEFSQPRMDKLLNFDSADREISVFISAGLYMIKDRSESVNLMVDKAGTAAQSVKGVASKKLVVYSEKFDRDIVRNEQLKRQIRQALKNGEIQPYYQPKVDVNTGELIGAEALARWITRDGKVISPAEFIPLCERTGQIVDVDNCIFDQVIDFLKDRIAENLSCVPISVNFSRLHLMGDEFIHGIIDRMQSAGIPPQLIQIELTESIIFENNEIIGDFVNHLHEHGLRACMDDFGSGYSSLNMLKDIPVDVLKIDKVFLNDTKNVKRRSLILTFIVRMAKQLGMDVVIEGVETAENVELMRKIGCNVAQGYYFARPMEKATFEKVFKEGKI